jgi:hypothetical protein
LVSALRVTKDENIFLKRYRLGMPNQDLIAAYELNQERSERSPRVKSAQRSLDALLSHGAVAFSAE